MVTISIQLPKLVNEVEVANAYGIVAREVKFMDQFGKDYDDLKTEYKTPRAICGYVVSGMAPYVAKAFKAEMDHKDINGILTNLSKDSKVVRSLIEAPMKSIQTQRKEYIASHKSEFKTRRDEDGYITDWVANFEISDYIQSINSELDNVFFLRHCGWEFPELAAETKHEEARRIEEEKCFKGQKVFIEVFWPKRKLMSIEEFIKERRDIKIFKEGRPMVFIADLLGHFVTFVALKIRETTKIVQEGLILLDSTQKGSYLTIEKGTASALKIGEMAFPDVYRLNREKSLDISTKTSEL